jgi:hypothetical protein
MKGMTIMKFKKLLSMAVAGAMILSMSVPAFATWNNSGSSGWNSSSNATSGNATSGGGGTETVEGGIAYGSEIQVPTVDIDVPTTGAVMLNPYRLGFKIGNDDHDEAFYSAPVIATNKSDCKVDVAVSAKATAEGEAKITESGEVATTEPGAKNVHIDLVVNTVTGSDATTVAAQGGKTIKFDAADKDYGFGTSKDDDATPITLNPGNEEANYLGFQLSGTINSKTEKVWAATDKVSVAIVLTFTPQPAKT